MKITEYIAIYAATITTLGLIWNVIQWYKQRGKLKVRAAICKNKGAYTEEAEPKEWGNLLRVDVVNSGKTSLTLTEIGLKTGRPKPWCFWRRRLQARLLPSVNQISFPYTLEPTKTASWLLESKSVLNLRAVKKFFIKDSHRKEWHASGSQVRLMRKIIKIENNNRQSK